MKSAATLAILMAGALITGARPVAAGAPPDLDDVPLTITGCVVAGESKDSYLLTNITLEGTTAAPPNAFYRFNTTDGLKDHVGRRVEVRGKADLDDVDEGKLRVRTDDGKTTTEITSERRTVKVDGNVWFGSLGSMKLDANVPTYKFEVEDVKRLEGNCAQATSAR